MVSERHQTACQAASVRVFGSGLLGLRAAMFFRFLGLRVRVILVRQSGPLWRR